MLVQEEFTNETEGYRFEGGPPYEPYTDNIADLFLSYQREFGRCISKIYMDPDAQAIGWVFEKKMKYSDCNEYYLQHTWVTLHNTAPVKTIEYNYKDLGKG